MGTNNLVFLENIEWFDDTGKQLVQRIPESGSGEIKWGAQLTVRESQAAVFFYKGKAEVIGFFFLGLGKLGIDQSLDKSAQGGPGKVPHQAFLGGDAFSHCIGGIGQHDFFPDMPFHHMAHFMAHHKEQFLIVHHVHEPAVNPDGAVGHGKGIDLV